MRIRPTAITLHGKALIYKKIAGHQGEKSFVLIHGIGASMRYFEDFAAHLSRGGNVYMLDLPGFGLSPKPQQSETIESYTQVVADFIKSLRIEKPLLIGHSMGCQIIVETLRIHPTVARGAVLIGPVVTASERRGLKQALRLLQNSRYEHLKTNWKVINDYFRCGPIWYMKVFPSMLEYSIEERIKEIKEPILLMRGERDRVASRGWIDGLQQIAPQATVFEVPRSGHGVMSNYPQEVAHICLEFSEQNAAR